ncbi:Outer membrane receptor proteins, mostly Fe transport [Pedobacter terrae]|uniref:Outer membrane receptor proteins, mostly Fe transport n=1 Tax=Pedobacter terrae TaxID=405671 RepID=A0A1G8CLS2_9SPHI|nr:outer membrane beta-barrel family protein [Pedobacter terrae]SDH46375.1 Outer membrane receptor proteins, mostly Fe transport [Pedobacter terrae]
MIKFLFSILLGFSTSFLYAQISISGSIRAKGSLMSNASVMLADSSGKYITGIKTDEHGKFTLFPRSTGRYRIEIFSVGFQTVKKNLEVKNESLDLGVIELIEFSEDLQEVTVSSKKPVFERKVDRMVFNIENSILTAGGDAVDAIKLAPGVRVDDKGISMVGKSTVKVMINDRLSYMSGSDLNDYLKTIDAGNIQKIEVITNPPANFDAEGNSGILNIVLKKNPGKRLLGNLTNSYALTSSGRSLGSSAINLGFNKEKISIQLSGFSSLGSTAPTEKNTTFYPQNSWELENSRTDKLRSINFNMGLEYKEGKSTFAAQYSLSVSRPGISETGNTNIKNNNRVIDSTLSTQANSRSKNLYNTVNFRYERKIDSLGKRWFINADYFSVNSDKDRNFITETIRSNGNNTKISGNNLSDQNYRVFVSELGFELPLKPFELIFGAKGSDINNANNALTTIQRDSFLYSEKTLGLYLSLKKKIGKLELKAGLRSEFTSTQGESIVSQQITTNNYGKLFPTIYAMYEMNDIHTFSASFGRRISRPAYSYLNPFKWYNNQYSYSEGNPFLQPSFIDNLEFVHTLNQNLSSSVYFSRTTGGYGQISILTPDNPLQITSVQNYYNSSQIGIQESYTFSLGVWESYNTANVYYNNSTGIIRSALPKLKGYGAYVSTFNTIKLSKSNRLSMDANYWLQLPEKLDLTSSGAYSQFDLGLKYLTKSKRFQFTLTANDVFKSNSPRMVMLNNNVRQQFNNYYDFSRIRFSLKYKFTDKDFKVKNLGANEERSRAN